MCGVGGFLYCKTQVKKKYYLPEDSEGVLVVLDIMSFLLAPVKCFWSLIMYPEKVAYS